MGAWKLGLGASLGKDGKTSFTVWAPRCERVEIRLLKDSSPSFHEMVRDADGYFHAKLENVHTGDRYFYRLNGKDDRPDPVSRFQPDGVHGASCVVDPGSFSWTDSAWKGIPYGDLIFYELHVGTFTPAGTFEAAIKKLPYLKELGITCVEIMPVAQFPGARNWGYDGVGLYAVQNSYGGPQGLKKLVDACHREGLAVCLDVVYNHLGPEGNYLHAYGPYFTKKYHTPWGDALNYDDTDCGPVRDFVVRNALYWVSEYHCDALRLDAIHGIYDQGPKHILRELNERVEALAKGSGRKVYVIAESDLNDSRVIRPYEQDGFGLAGQWSDDFHHAVHVLLTGERSGYYEDFTGLADLPKVFTDGFVYDGKFSTFRKRQHGNLVNDLDPRKLVICVQNHDQVGNRAFGDRFATLCGFDKEKLAAILLLLAPNTPLVFMGQEYGEKAPFRYFVDHGDPDLIRAVREGRTKEFASFGWTEVPDPGSEKTFLDSKLKWNYQVAGHKEIWCLYKDLIALRKARLRNNRLTGVYSDANAAWLAWEYASGFKVVVSFSGCFQEIKAPFKNAPAEEFLNTMSSHYGGSGLRILNAKKTVLAMPPLCAWVGE